MKYFFLIYAIVAAVVIGMLPTRGDKFTQPPIRLFPDMDEQDKVKAQAHEEFFADGMGARHPVAGTRPVGFLPEWQEDLGGIPEYEFGGDVDYYHTGTIDGYYSKGMPAELGLTEENVNAFLRRGAEMYHVNCMPCHGESGDGQGIASQFGVPGVANLTLENYGPAAYPDGRLYDVIANGKGNMGPYKHNLSVRDRWAVVAYVRAMQAARRAPLADESIKAAFDAHQAAAAEGSIQ